VTLQIAITGGIGSGKSLLADWLRTAGHPVLDADRLGRQVVDEDPALQAVLIAEFGAAIRGPAGLDRAELGRRAFASAARLERLNALVFPYLWDALESGLSACQAPACFVDAALVFEWGVAGHFAEIWVVTAPAALRLERAARRLGRPPEELRARLEHQMPQEEKIRRASCVLDNGAAPLQLWEQADEQLRRLALAGLPPHTRPVGA
jgi:dephospho-CoA kinase